MAVQRTLIDWRAVRRRIDFAHVDEIQANRVRHLLQGGQGEISLPDVRESQAKAQGTPSGHADTTMPWPFEVSHAYVLLNSPHRGYNKLKLKKPLNER